MSDKRNSSIKQVTRDKQEAILLKKGSTKFTDSPILTPYGQELKGDEPNKALIERNLPFDTDEAVYRTIIANTYNYMDSHDDVHLNNVFKKSLDENKNLFLLHDHKFEVTAQTGNILKAYEQEGRFIYYGYNSPLDTQALLMDVEIERAKNELVFNEYKNHRINQHSVGMIYVKLELAVNDEDFGSELATWNKYYNDIANKEDVDAVGYFWAVTEAKLIEGSAVPIGSNTVTPTLEIKEPEKSTQEPEQATLKDFRNEFKKLF